MTDEKIIGMLSIGAPIRKGPRGPIGPVGPTGATGPQGLTGPRGEQGEKGETGERGPAGERGRMGEQGPKGDIGPKGERGPVGPMGMQGIQGIPGPRGEAGPQGPRGAVGPQGERGNDGFTGAQGAIGPRGPQGIQGERGEKGERGDGLRVIGTVDKESDIQEPKRPGDIYYVTSRNELVVYTGTKWVNLGQLRGPQGQKGDTGAQGPEGPQGPIGIQGPIGPIGPVGPKGDVGDAAILDEKVSNVNAWSSKQIIDHLLQDNTWRDYNDTKELVNATNGYIKGLEIEGQTLKNLVPTPNDFSKWTKLRGNITTPQKATIRIEGTSDIVNAIAETNLILERKEYTLFFEYKAGGDNFEALKISKYDAYGGVIVTKSSPSNEYQKVKVKIGVEQYDNRHTFLNIYVIPKDTGIGDYWGEIKNLMILEGDYTQKDVPDFIEGVQGVGLKTEKGYKIGVKTHGKNLAFEKLGNVVLDKGDKNLYSSKNCYTYIAKVEPNKTYVMSNKGGNRNTVGTFSTKPKVKDVAIRTENSNKITIREGENFIAWYVNNESVKEAKNVQIEENTQATKYEPYKESTSEIILQDQLQGIGDIKDKLYFDEGYKVEKNIYKYVPSLDDINYSVYPKDEKGLTYIEISLLDDIIDSRGNKVVCNVLPSIRDFNGGTVAEEGVCVTYTSKKLRLSLKNDKLDTKDTKGVLKWLVDNKAVFYIKKLTPTTIDTQIKTELLPQTYKNKTYISVDMGVNGTLSGTYPEEIDFTKAVVKVLTLYGVQMTPPQQPPAQDEPTTLEEFEIDEPTTLEELTDEPTTLEEV